MDCEDLVQRRFITLGPHEIPYRVSMRGSPSFAGLAAICDVGPANSPFVSHGIGCYAP
jgi:hypothetical protein